MVESCDASELISFKGSVELGAADDNALGVELVVNISDAGWELLSLTAEVELCSVDDKDASSFVDGSVVELVAS